MGLITTWLHRNFSDPQVVGLALVLVTGFAIIVLTGNMLAPVLASIVIAYLLEGLVGYLERNRIMRIVAVIMVFAAFMAFLLFVIFAVLPLLSRQATQLIQQLPTMAARGQDLLLALPEQYPDLFSASQVRDLIDSIRAETVQVGQQVLSFSLNSVVGLITLVVYLFLMPLMVFFFLKDKRLIHDSLRRFLPKERRLVGQVWADVDVQIGNYVRGKFIEILMLWLMTYIAFGLMGMQFAMLLAVLVGLSVLIPFIGAVAVTVPVAVLAYFQWGFTSEFAWLLFAYAVIQAIDGIVVVPLLFSEVVNVHPIAIIVAILIFGGLWGFWGVFFAIPLATLVQAVLKAWPTGSDSPPVIEEGS